MSTSTEVASVPRQRSELTNKTLGSYLDSFTKKLELQFTEERAQTEEMGQKWSRKINARHLLYVVAAANPASPALEVVAASCPSALGADSKTCEN